MQQIRTEEEFTCQKCDREAKVRIEFDHATYILCKKHEEKLAEKIKRNQLSSENE